MKRQALIPIVLSCLVWSTTSHADITDFSYTSDYTNLSCTASIDYTLGPSVGTVTMDSYQYASPGRMGFQLGTSSVVGQNSLVVNQTVDNDTGIAWSGYQVKIYMDRTFSLSNVSVGNPPPNWTFTFSPVSASPTPVYFGPGEYVAEIDFSKGTLGSDLPPLGEFNFGYKLTFTGSLHYQIAADLTPVFAPEPGSASLLLLGGLVFAGYRRLRR